MRVDRSIRTGSFFLLVFSVCAGACARLGFRDRVLWRVPSPDGRIVAVCQEVPEFDGPSYGVRLEQPDGSLLRQLYTSGDGDPCSEIAWSADGRTLAVLSSHVARIRFVDVDWAMNNPSTTTRHWSWRQLSFSGERESIMGKGLRFTGPLSVELQLCPYSLAVVQRTGNMECTSPPVAKQTTIPQPIVTGHPAT